MAEEAQKNALQAIADFQAAGFEIMRTRGERRSARFAMESADDELKATFEDINTLTAKLNSKIQESLQLRQKYEEAKNVYMQSRNEKPKIGRALKIAKNNKEEAIYQLQSITNELVVKDAADVGQISKFAEHGWKGIVIPAEGVVGDEAKAIETAAESCGIPMKNKRAKK